MEAAEYEYLTKQAPSERVLHESHAVGSRQHAFAAENMRKPLIKVCDRSIMVDAREC